MALPESNIFDITAHPTDIASLIGWMFRIWQSDSDATILVLVMPDESKDVINRIRVRLSEARKQVKLMRQPLASEFGINTEYFSWTREDGEARVAIKITKFQTLRHRLRQSIAHSSGFQALAKGIK